MCTYTFFYMKRGRILDHPSLCQATQAKARKDKSKHGKVRQGRTRQSKTQWLRPCNQVKDYNRVVPKRLGQCVFIIFGAGAARLEQGAARWEQLQRSGSSCCEEVEGAARSDQVQWGGSRCHWGGSRCKEKEHSGSRCSEVGAGAARWEQMQGDRIRYSEVEQGAARWEHVERGQQNKKLQRRIALPTLWYNSIVGQGNEFKTGAN